MSNVNVGVRNPQMTTTCTEHAGALVIHDRLTSRDEPIACPLCTAEAEIAALVERAEKAERRAAWAAESAARLVAAT